MDVSEFATNFGLPGLLIAAWYLLQSKRDDRAGTLEEKKLAAANAHDERKLQLEERRLSIEDKKADAMATALTSLSGKVDAHHTLDIESHRELGEGIAEIKGQLEGARWYREEVTNPGTAPPVPTRTPPRGVRAPSRGQFHDEEG